MNKPTYEELEAQVKQLAAENAALKDLARGWATATDDQIFEETGDISHDCIEDCNETLLAMTPATDAILASLRAEGVEMFALMYAEEAIKDGSDNTDWKARASAAASEYAAQLRSKSEVQHD